MGKIGVIWEDNFDDGNLDMWNIYEGSFRIRTNQIYEGGYSAGIEDNYAIRDIADIIVDLDTPTTLEFYYYETSESTGGGILLEDSDGNPVIGVASDNSEWSIDDGWGFNQVYHTSGIYNRWHYVKIEFNWEDGNADIYWEDTTGGHSDTFYNRPLKTNSDIYKLCIKNQSGENWIGSTPMYMWFDSITFLDILNVDLELPSKNYDVGSSEPETIIRVIFDSVRGYREEFDRDFLRGDLRALVTREDLLQIPQEIDTTLGPDEIGDKLFFTDSKCAYIGTISDRKWIVFRDQSYSFSVGRSIDSGMDWDYLEKVFYTPIGGANPSIVFNNLGQYVLVFEALPANATEKEIWLVEPPYSGDGVRQLDYGLQPKFYKSWNGRIYLFFLSLDRKKIYGYTYDDNFSERKLIREFDSPIDFRLPAAYREPEYDYSFPTLALFYEDEDVTRLYSNLRELLYCTFDEYEGPNLSLDNIFWEGAAYNVYFTVYDKFYERISDVNITVEGQRSQETIEMVTDENGESFATIIPYNILYQVLLEHEDYGNINRYAILIFNHEETREMHVSFQLFEQPFKDTMEYPISEKTDDIFWENREHDIKVNVTDRNNNPLPNCNVELVGQHEQETLSAVTDSNGVVGFSNIMAYKHPFNQYHSPYQLLLNHPDSGFKDYWSVRLVNPANQDYIEMPTGILDNTDKTFELEINQFSNSNTYRYLLDLRGDIQFILAIYDDRLHVWVSGAWNRGWNYWDYHDYWGYPISDRKNYNVAVTYNSTDNMWRLYVDGEHVWNNDRELNVGELDRNRISSDNYGNSFYGLIKDVRIWDKELTQEEIQNNINNGVVGDELGLTLYYPMNEGSGDKVYDIANSYDGDIKYAHWATEETSDKHNPFIDWEKDYNNNELLVFGTADHLPSETIKTNFDVMYFDTYEETTPSYSFGMDDILWEAQKYNIDIEVFDKNRNPVEGCKVTIIGQEGQDTVSAYTDVEGIAYFFDIIAYNSYYEITLEYEGYENDYWGILLYYGNGVSSNDIQTSFTVYLEKIAEKEDSYRGYTFGLDSILWIEF